MMIEFPPSNGAKVCESTFVFNDPLAAASKYEQEATRWGRELKNARPGRRNEVGLAPGNSKAALDDTHWRKDGVSRLKW